MSGTDTEHHIVFHFKNEIPGTGPVRVERHAEVGASQKVSDGDYGNSVGWATVGGSLSTNCAADIVTVRKVQEDLDNLVWERTADLLDAHQKEIVETVFGGEEESKT